MQYKAVYTHPDIADLDVKIAVLRSITKLNVVNILLLTYLTSLCYYKAVQESTPAPLYMDKAPCLQIITLESRECGVYCYVKVIIKRIFNAVIKVINIPVKLWNTVLYYMVLCAEVTNAA